MRVGNHLRYARTVARHKWYVFVAGLQLGVPLWQLIVHDLTKLSRAEWGPYVRRFGAGRAGVQDKSADPEEFHAAFRHHWQHNPHHWEHWVAKHGVARQMPERYVREMVADWMGAGRAYNGHWDIEAWWVKNRDRILLHPATRERVEELRG